MNNNFTSNLKSARSQTNMSQKKIAELLHISQQAYAKYETGTASPNPEMIASICELLKISTDELLGVSPIIRESDEQNHPKGNWIPVLGRVAAGIPKDAVEDIIDYEELDEGMNPAEYTALQINGASMEPRMMTGDVVIVHLQDDADTGDTVVAIVNGEDATVKKLKKDPHGIMLIPTNPNYEPILYSNRDIEELPVRILGKVVELRAKF